MKNASAVSTLFRKAAAGTSTVAARAALLVIGISFSFAAQAQVFKCVDANGKTVYSQSPCPAGSKASTISSRQPAAAPATTTAKADPKAAAKAAPANAADQDLEFRKRQKEREEAEKKTAEQTAQAKQAQEACTRAKDSAQQYEIGGRISRINAQGERTYLSDEEIAQEKSKAQAAVAQNCR